MKKQRRDVVPGKGAKRPLRRLTLHRETLQHLNDPRLGGALGGALAAHTFTGANNNAQQDATLCG